MSAPTSTTPPSFGAAFRQQHFSFAPTYRPLNHGSFGAVPNAIAAHQQHLQRETEQRSDLFLRYTYPGLLRATRAALAPLLGAHTDEVVLVPNATTGVNTVLRNLGLGGGDVVVHFSTVYGGCLRTLQSVGETAGVEARAVVLAYPVADGEVVWLFAAAVRGARAQGKVVRVAMFDAVVTAPGVRFPWEAVVAVCREMGVLSLLDAAHGLGHVDLEHLGVVRPDFMVSNCYKCVWSTSHLTPHSYTYYFTDGS